MNSRKNVPRRPIDITLYRKKEFDALLAAFPTAKDFFDYFVTKIKNFERQNAAAIDQMDVYKDKLNQTYNLEDKLQERDEQTFKLQESLGELQCCLYDERENYIKLVAENEQIKLENEDYKRKFQTVLFLSGMSAKDVTHFLQRNPNANKIIDEMAEIREEIQVCSGEKKNKYELLNPVILSKQVTVLEKQFSQLSSLHKAKVFGLTDELQRVKEEREVKIQHLEERLRDVSSRLTENSELLHKALVDNLELHRSMMNSEQDWVDERERLSRIVIPFTRWDECECQGLIKPDSPREHPKLSSVDDELTAIIKRLRKDLARAENQLLDRENLLEEYKMQALRYEKDLHRAGGENDVYKKNYDEQAKKLVERNKLLSKRLEEADRRRKLDAAGFREDIKSLRQFITALEKKVQETNTKKLKVRAHEDVLKATIASLASARSRRSKDKRAVAKTAESRGTHGGHGDPAAAGKRRRKPAPALSPVAEDWENNESARSSAQAIALNRFLEIASQKVSVMENLLRNPNKATKS